MEETTYKVMNYKEFFSKYNKTKEDSRFINRAYSQSNNTVSVYEDELKYDCYFQCPDYGEEVVPEHRRYIYILKKDSWNAMKYNTNIAPNGKKRISININQLDVFADPYLGSLSDDIFEETPEQWLANQMEKLMKEYETRKQGRTP